MFYAFGLLNNLKLIKLCNTDQKDLFKLKWRQ